MFFAQGTGSWDLVGTLIVSDNLADAPTFEENARLVMTNLDLVGVLETNGAVIDKVVLAGGFAQRAVLAALRDLYPRVRFELRATAPANDQTEYEEREQAAASGARW